MIVIEAPGGYGKSLLAAELVAHWQEVTVDTPLAHAAVTAPVLAARLHEAVVRAGFTDAASAAERTTDPGQVVEAIVTGLALEPCVFVIDDAHNAAGDAAALIHQIAVSLEPGHRLVLLGRRLPEGAERLRRAEYVQLTARDLALDVNETLSLCRTGFGLDIDERTARALVHSTGGWTAATALVAARAARTGEPVETLTGPATRPGDPAGALAAILEEALATLGREAGPALAQVARLPVLDAELVTLTTSQPDLFDRLTAAGVPVVPSRGGWWEIPGPVRDHLVQFAPADTQAMRRAAGAYRTRGELGPALELLVANGDPDEAAALLAATPPDAEDELDTLEFHAHFGQMTGPAIDAHPALLVLGARRFGHAGRYALCCELLERALAIARRTGDIILERAAAVELVKVELLADLRYEESVEAARAILEAAGPDERLTRARANEFLGYALCHLEDAGGPRFGRDLLEAEDAFSRASRLYRELGMRSATAFIAVDWASLIEFPRGQARAALERIEEAIQIVIDRPRAYAFLLLWRATFAAELGMDELGRASIDEVLRIAELKKSFFLVGQAHWRLAALSSYRGDGAATLHHVRQVEANGKVWLDLVAAEFFADAADLLARVGQSTLALDYLDRAKSDPKHAGHRVELSQAVVEARLGDPNVADALLTRLASSRLDARECWRVTLLRSFAAFRRGEDSAAASLAANAFEEAARLGEQELPLIRERMITEQLLGLAAATGHPAALELRATALPRTLSLLGRFELSEAGRPIPLRAGQEAQLLKVVAISGGRILADQAIEVLWPDAGRSAGRHRLRTVLNRLRTTCGELVSREGEALVLDPAVMVDLHEFVVDTQAALALAAGDLRLAAARARSAIARYHGRLLPDDLYEDWAEKPRREAESAMLDLLDLCAAEAATRGDLDTLRRAVERTIEFAPYDDARYLRAASALLEQGRRGEAVAVVKRARSTFAQIGLDPPDPLIDLERRLLSARVTHAVVT